MGGGERMGMGGKLPMAVRMGGKLPMAVRMGGKY